MGKKITIGAGADELGVSKRTVRRLIPRGELPAYHVASLIRIDRDDLTKVLRPVTPNEEQP